ncbi:MAG TPA: enoyl-CoA hydratase-related protein [Acidimicrobiia bacterium]|nr:enoyl-CoA hydratase-related protein [Acidimicrobiia bacterium]
MADSSTDEVLYEVEPSGVAWLALNRPDAGNAVTVEQRRAILDLLEDAAADLGVRAIVLTATGDRHFCTGADLRVAMEPDDRAHPDAPERPIGTVMRGLERQLGAQRLVSAFQDCPKPIIAAVNGTAAGLGAHLAFACDLVIAADTARFIEVFVRRGLIPDGGGPYLVTRLVGPQKAKELFFFGDDVPADEAVRIGLANRVVPAAELRERAREWAERLAAGPTVAIGLAKRLVNSALESERSAAFRAEALAVEVSMQSADSVEGVQAFVERRPVEFKGW